MRKELTLSYTRALVETHPEYVDVRMRMGEERLLRRVAFGEVVEGKGHSCGLESGWMGRLEEDRRAV